MPVDGTTTRDMATIRSYAELGISKNRCHAPNPEHDDSELIDA